MVDFQNSSSRICNQKCIVKNGSTSLFGGVSVGRYLEYAPCKKKFLGFIGGISCQAPAEILLEINKKTAPRFEILLQPA